MSIVFIKSAIKQNRSRGIFSLIASVRKMCLRYSIINNLTSIITVRFGLEKKIIHTNNKQNRSRGIFSLIASVRKMCLRYSIINNLTSIITVRFGLEKKINHTNNN